MVDKVILLSGDGDFDLLLKRIAEKYGVSTEVYGVKSLTSNTLIQSAYQFNAIGKSLLI